MTLSRPVTISLWSFLAIAILLIAAISWLLNGSKASLSGTIAVSGLSQPSTVERDAQGLVTIKGKTRDDIAFSLGFVHGQERFFQMDLLRRNSAGELSELFGVLASEHDSKVRLHQFRLRAERAFAQLPKEHQQLLSAYANGVNSGSQALAQKPFEYLLLQAESKAWVPADSLLVVYSMYMDLQDEWGEAERSLSAMDDMLPSDWMDFLVPLGGQWDATLDDGDATFSAPFPATPLSSYQLDQAAARPYQYIDQIEIGSNNWSVAGGLTPHGAALVADDMHLGLRVPNIWFRASWYLPQDNRRVTGATLPGTPLMVVGSNEHIAWGFTNSYGDYMDLIRLQTNDDASEYLTPDGWEAFQLTPEIIRIKGQPSSTVQVKNTRWGPVIGDDHDGHLLAMRWVAHDPAGLNLGLFELETANTVHDAFAVAQRTGIPGQNLNVGDKQGNIGWTIMGALPERFGFASGAAERRIADWSDGSIGWKGKLPAEQYPHVMNPASGRLWTANARMVSGEDYRRIGDGMGALGARQQQIRDRLLARDQFTEHEFLALHLDDEAVFLSRWQQLLSQVLASQSIVQDSRYDEFRSAVNQWSASASADSVGYLLVKRFREGVIRQTVGLVLEYVASRTDNFWPYAVDNRIEYATWALVTGQPEKHLPKGATSWGGLLQSVAVQVFEQHNDPSSGLAEATWGRANSLSIRHPLSNAVPMLSKFLDMPKEPMSGDTFMPRVQGRAFGASQRMAVSPGYEENGYFHMATGQSGHPLSPFYQAGHEDWVKGNASNFLPGKTQYVLKLKPEN